MSEVNGRYAVAEILPLGTALANVVAARGEPDEFDKLLMESEEETPLSIERITLDENGFNRRDADGKKESVGKTIDGVIVMVTKPRSIFVDEDDDFPLCQSLDGITGIVSAESLADETLMESASEKPVQHPVIANPGQRVFSCASCALSRWGSANGDDRGPQACKSKRALLTLPEDQDMPIIVTASPTSIKTVEDYLRKRSNRKDKAFFLVHTQLGTIPQNEGKMDWGKLTLTNLGNEKFKDEDGKPNDFAIWHHRLSEERQGQRIRRKSSGPFPRRLRTRT